MFTLCKTFRFEASHQLVHHDGACARLHGHSYSVDVEVRSEHLIGDGPKRGMVIDYHDLSAAVDPVIARLDHQHLNEVLECESTTAEYIASWIFRELAPSLPLLSAVTVHETAKTHSRYERDR